jgi:hypothetical protein
MPLFQTPFETHDHALAAWLAIWGSTTGRDLLKFTNKKGTEATQRIELN